MRDELVGILGGIVLVLVLFAIFMDLWKALGVAVAALIILFIIRKIRSNKS